MPFSWMLLDRFGFIQDGSHLMCVIIGHYAALWSFHDSFLVEGAC